MAKNKMKRDGMTVQEIENVARKYHAEIFFCLVFLLAGLFTSTFFGRGWSLLLSVLGGIVGVWRPQNIAKTLSGTFAFIHKQEMVTKFVIGGATLIVSIFLPPLVFFAISAIGGECLYTKFCEGDCCHINTEQANSKKETVEAKPKKESK